MKTKDVNIAQMKYNLIQNFYVVGYSLEDFFQMKSEKVGVISDIFKDSLKYEIVPKLISKYPNLKNYNSITDDLIVSHCFPKGLKIIENQNEPIMTHFEFTLDNIPANYIEEEKSIYSKIYFNCLEFYETLSQYIKLKKEIIERSGKYKIAIEKVNKNEIITEETEKKYKSFYIPKVICFASLLPFGNELGEILKNIYNFYLANLISNNNMIPIEKLIEQLVMRIPAPVSSNAEISVSFKFNNLKTSNANLNFEKILFPVYNLKEAYIKNYESLSLGELFNYFSAEDIVRIFRYMLLEIPLLFFSTDKGALSLFVDNFLSLLNPFVYVLPHISVLPNELYGLINSEPKFIFGINENYAETFFEENNIDLDKSIVIVSLKSENKNQSKIIEKLKKMEDSESLVINEQTKKKDNDRNTDEYIFYYGTYVNLLNIEFPSFKKKTISLLNNLVTTYKKKFNLSDIKQIIEQKFNHKVQNIFFKFFIYLMQGYSNYLLNSKFFGSYIKIRNMDYNLRYKNVDTDFIKELFNLDEFINSHKDEKLFYTAFCNTKIFMNFFQEKIYCNNDLDVVRHEQFDQFIYLKKHKDFRKKKENKGLYENFRKNIIDKDPIDQNIDILISNEIYFSRPETAEILKDSNPFKVLTKYGQLIQGSAKKGKHYELPSLNYFVFPKLLFDDSFFHENYETLLIAHTLNLPTGGLLDAVKKKSIVYSDTNTKYRKYMSYEEILANNKESNNSKENFEIKYISYIYFSWLILLGCSLWYCEPIERNIRINKIFELLNKLEYVEEKVLLFLFINIYKFGNKYQFIKMHKINLKFIGYSNYFLLNLLYNKLKEKEEGFENEEEPMNVINTDKKDENEEEEKDDEYSLKKRYLIDMNGKLIKDFLEKNTQKYKKRKTNEQTNIIITQDKEEIVFSTEQFCQKCGNVTNIVPDDLIKNKVEPNLEYFKYKCQKCGEVQNEVHIKYHILLSNFQKKEAIVMGEGDYKLSTPYKFYQNIKNYFQKRKNYELNIENIFNEKELNLPFIIFYFSIINLSFDFLLPYKKEEDEIIRKKTKNESKINENEFVPIKINYDNDDVYRRFNNLVPLFIGKKKFWRRTNITQTLTIEGKKKKK